MNRKRREAHVRRSMAAGRRPVRAQLSSGDADALHGEAKVEPCAMDALQHDVADVTPRSWGA